MIYFDNAATTFPKPKSVINAVYDCISNYCGNPGRGSHNLSRRSAEAVFSVRERIAKLFCIDSPENVVFTYNATYALNLALKTLITENCHVLTSDIEHNSVIRPLEKLKRTLNITYDVFDSEGELEQNIKKSIKKDTKVLVSTLASNVTGKRIPFEILSRVAEEYGLKLIIDASQAAGHMEIDLSATKCDVLCAPGHKALFGIQGCGFAVFKDSKIKESFIEGGSGTDSQSILMPTLLPEGYEAGTLSTPAIVGLGAGIDFVTSASIYNINYKISNLANYIKSELAKTNDIIIYPSFGSIVAFNNERFDSNAFSEILDQNGICVRSGLHCAPSAHKKLGTINGGCVRVSLSYFNDFSEIDSFLRVIKKI